MKGATAEPSVNTIKDPNNNSTKIIGAIQSFFLSMRNPSKSLINSIISTVSQSDRGALADLACDSYQRWMASSLEYLV